MMMAMLIERGSSFLSLSLCLSLRVCISFPISLSCLNFTSQILSFSLVTKRKRKVTHRGGIAYLIPARNGVKKRS